MTVESTAGAGGDDLTIVTASTVLAVDTSGAEGSLALGRVGGLGASGPGGFADGAATEILGEAMLTGRRYAAALLPELRGLLARCGVDLSALDAIVVVHGPGSFTGIRMGLSAVKGLSEARGVPVAAISRLRVLAEVNNAQAALLDAGRSEVYAGILEPNASGGAPAWHESLRTLADARESLIGSADCVVCEPALADARESLIGSADCVVCEPALAAALPGARLVSAPSATDALRIAAARVRAGDFDDIASLDGNYVHRRESELFGGGRPAGAETAQSSREGSAP